MKQTLLYLVLLFSGFFMQNNAYAQTLQAGDIAFIGYVTDDPDGFTFIALKDLPAGEVIYFTDKGWNATDDTWYANTEDHIIWTAPTGGLSMGTVVSIIETSADVFTVSQGTAVLASGSELFTLSAGDNIFAYQSSSGIEPASPTFIAGIYGDDNYAHTAGCDDAGGWLNCSTCTHLSGTCATTGTSTSGLPVDLTNGENAIALFPTSGEKDNAKYTGTLTGTVSTIRAAINNPANWSSSDDPINIASTEYSGINITPDAPACTMTASISSQTNVACNGGNTGSLTVTASDGTSNYSYSWSNGSSTSNTSSTTNTISGLTAGTYSVTITDGSGCTATASATITEPTVLTASGQVTSNVTCNGGNNGAATVNVTGGSSPYTYAWSNGAATQSMIGLTAGTYSVTVTDANGCTATAGITVTQPISGISASAIATNVSCNGGSDGAVDLTVTGGTAPYTFVWNNTATTEDMIGLEAGTYSVTVTDANGCTATESVEVTEPAVLSASGVATNVSCNGGSNGAIDLTVTGGTAPYTFVWSNTATTEDMIGLEAGTYSVTVTDANGCTATESVEVTEPTVLSASGVATNVSCNGGSDGAVDLTVTGGTAPYTFVWSNTATTEDMIGLEAGTYSVTVTDANGCTATESVDVTEAILIASGQVTSNVTCNGGNDGAATVNVTGGSSPYTYAWSNGETTQSMLGLTAGTYSVTVTDANGCTATAGITVTQPISGISASGVATNISCNGGSDGAVDLTVTGGTAPYTFVWSNTATTEDMIGLEAGTYSVTVTDANGCTATESVEVLEPTILEANGVGTDATCAGNDGTVDLTVTGGTTPYTFVWSNTATTEDMIGLEAGTYNVTVTDSKGCTTTESVVIGGSPAIIVNAVVTSVSCNGDSNGRVNLTVTGGTAPYTYEWSNGETSQNITGLTIGTYEVIVTDANACTATESVEILEPVALEVSTSVSDNASCSNNDGAAMATATGGTAPYVYSWSNGATTEEISGVSSGTYEITVTDANGCTAISSATIEGAVTAPVITVADITSVTCTNGTDGAIDINVTGGTTPYTYSWSNGATTEDISGLSAGTYAVTVTGSDNCSATQYITVTEPDVLSIVAPGVANGILVYDEFFTQNQTYQPGSDNYDNWASFRESIDPDSYYLSITISGSQLPDGLTLNDPVAATAIAQALRSGNQEISFTVNGVTWGVDFGCSAIGINTNAVELVVNTTGADISGCGCGSDSYKVIRPGIANTNWGGLGTGSTCGAVSQNMRVELVNGGLINNVTCNGNNDGSIEVAGIGGTAPYTYSWDTGETSTSITNLAPGDYSVTITDANGCFTTQNYTIIEPDVLTVNSITQTPTSCNGGDNGSINLTIIGGTTPYTYLWNNGETTQNLSNLTAGTYSVTVTDANGCIVTDTVEVLEPLEIDGNETVTNVSTNENDDGSITLNTIGGTSPYTYYWNGITEVILATQGFETSGGTWNYTLDPSTTYNTEGDSVIDNYLSNVWDTVEAYNHNANTSAAEGNQFFAAQMVNNTNGGGDFPHTITFDAIDVSAYGDLILEFSYYALNYNSNFTTQYIVAYDDANTWTDTPVDLSKNTGGWQKVTINVPSSANYVRLRLQTHQNGNYQYLGFDNVRLYEAGPSGETLTDLSAGTYSVVITDDNGCSVTEDIVVSEPATLSASGVATNVSCNGGSNGTVNLTVTGGTAPYTYVWSNTATTQNLAGLEAGTYNVTVTDANGYTTTESVEVTEPNVLIASGQVTSNVTCNGGNDGAVNVNVTGGTSPYTYAWSNGATTENMIGLTAGTYNVTVTDANGCTATESVTVTQPVSGISASTATTNVSCNGGNDGTVDLTVTGGTAPYTYLWSNTATTQNLAGLEAGTYDVTVTDANGCTTTASAEVGQPEVLSASGVATNISCNGEIDGEVNLTVSGGTVPYTYVWSNTATTQNLAGLEAGTYSVTVTDANGCTANASVTVTEPAALSANITLDNHLTCSDDNNGGATVEVTGGMVPYTYEWDNQATTASVTNLTLGNHSVTITDKSGCTATQTVNIDFNDSTLPVPDVSTLPNISEYCEVNKADVPTPTATDNCSGTLEGTTNAIFPINTPGITTITWIFEDENGNKFTQQQDIIVQSLPLSDVSFSDVTVAYDGTVHSIEVNGLPTGASVNYQNNGQTDAGSYEVIATLNPGSSGCSSTTLTATLTIEKAEQTISFNEILDKSLETDTDFSLAATASSGLPVSYTYSYSADTPPAEVSEAGEVSLLTSGTVEITAHQEGNENYSQATPVTRTLTIESSDATIHELTINGEVYDSPDNNIYYLIDCNNDMQSVEINLRSETNANSSESDGFVINTSAPGIYERDIELTSQDGSQTERYKITIEKRFSYEDIIVRKFNNVLLINNNPETNGGYHFESFEWYKDGVLMGTDQYYSAGENSTNQLDLDANYSATMTTEDGDVLQTCDFIISQDNVFTMAVSPNPVSAGSSIDVITNFTTKMLDNMTIRVSRLYGTTVLETVSETNKSQINLPATMTSGTYIVTSTADGVKLTGKIIVK